MKKHVSLLIVKLVALKYCSEDIDINEWLYIIYGRSNDKAIRMLRKHAWKEYGLSFRVRSRKLQITIEV